jgi:hypothetical protein
MTITTALHTVACILLTTTISPTAALRLTAVTLFALALTAIAIRTFQRTAVR